MFIVNENSWNFCLDSSLVLWQLHNHETCNYQCQNKVMEK